MPASAEPEHRTRAARSQRRISEQHLHLGQLESELQSALGRGDDDGTAHAFRQLAGAIDAHFELEERAYYPDPNGDAELAATFEGLVGEHAELRGELERLREVLTEGNLHAFSSAFHAFSTALGEHEAEEEKAMERIVRGE